MLFIKLRTLFILLFFLQTTYSIGQEICDNGIDDDNDGLVDLNDITECSCSSSPIVEDGFLFNPSFENHKPGGCPDGTDLDSLLHWVDGVVRETPDYYHRCGSFGGATKPIPDGDGYIGFLSNQDSNDPNKMYKEYVGQCLQKPLKAGKATTFEFHLTGGDWQAQPHPITMAIFGTTDCNNFPQNKVDSLYTFGCPNNGPNYIELGSVSTTPNSNGWTQWSISFTPTQDIAAVIIGADCSDVLPFDITMPAASRYYMDDLKLTQTTPASSETAQITLTGNACDNNQQLTAQTSIVGGNYQWYKDGIAIIGATANNYNISGGSNSGGDYQVYVTGSGACALSNIISIPNGGTIDPGFSMVTGCGDHTVDFMDTSASINATISSWEWDFGDNSPVSSQPSPSHTYASIGSYVVKLIVTSNQNCKDSIEKTIAISNEKPTAAFSVVSACEGASVNFTNASASSAGIASYNWDFGGLGNSSLPNPSFVFNASGTQNVTLTVTDNGGCTHDTTQQIEVYEKPLADFSFTDTCAGSIVEFLNTSTIGSGTIQSSSWDFGDNVGSSPDFSPIYKYASPGSYNVSLTVTSDRNCSGVISKTGVQYEIPKPNFSFTEMGGCVPLCINFSDNSTISNGSIIALNWDFGNDSTSSDPNPTMCFENSDYDISLIAVSDKGCIDTLTQTQNVNKNSIIHADFLVDVEPSNEETAKVNFTDISLGDPINWNWTFYSMDTTGVLGSSNQANDYFIFPTDTGFYPVKLFIRNQDGCIDSIIKLVALYPDFRLFMPNTFTPNGDGINEHFFPIGIGFSPSEDYSLTIFNHWGDLIFESNHLTDAWDGIAHKIGGKELVQQSVYIWRLVVRDLTADNKIHRLNGHVQVVY